MVRSIINNLNSPKPFPSYLIDTEGLGVYDEEINHGSNIFFIAVLISSLLVYNAFCAIDKKNKYVLNFQK